MKKLLKISILIIGFWSLGFFKTPTFALFFSDVPLSHPNFDAVIYAQTQDIVQGYPDGSFKPDQQINRAEFLKIVVEAVTDSGIPEAGEKCFSDVDRKVWFEKYTCFAKAQGIVQGYADGTFKPVRNIEFVEAAKIIVNAFGISPTPDETIWYRPFVTTLENKKAIPTSITSFAKQITRGEMAEIIYRLKADIRDEDSTTYAELSGTVETQLPASTPSSPSTPSNLSNPSSPSPSNPSNLSNPSPTPPLACTSDKPLGINLDYHRSYAPEIMFVDAFKSARPWISSNDDHWDPDNTEVAVPMRDDGYPLEIPYYPASGTWQGRPQRVKTPMLDNMSGHFPTGTYNLIFEGTGKILLAWDAGNKEFTNGGTYPFEIAKAEQGILLNIRSSATNDPIHNIRVIMPGHLETYQTKPFYPPFFEKLKSMAAVRFMNTMGANDYPCDDAAMKRDNVACVMTWAKRTRPDTAIQTTTRGVAVEHLAQLANEANLTPWFNLPHGADDEYIREFAKVVKQTLYPGRKFYIELSNEVWNGSFSQYNYMQNKGNSSGLGGGGEPLPGIRYLSKRSAEMFDIIEQVFGSEKDRVIKVLPSQSAGVWISQKILENFSSPEINPKGIKASVLAIAPYFGGNVGSDIERENKVDSITISEILDRADATITEDTGIATNKQKEVAEQYGLQLVAYEGGQHLIGNQNNDTLTAKLTKANQDPRMYDIYKKMLNAWYDNGGDLFLAYHLVGKFTKYGSWGSMEWLDQPLSEAHKYRALREHLDATCP